MELKLGESNKRPLAKGFTVVVDVDGDGQGFYEEFHSKANAKEFIRRWNSQPKLLEACEMMVDNKYEPDKLLIQIESFVAKAIAKATNP